MKTKRIALAFIVSSYGKILLVKRSANEEVRGGEWYLPGGHCRGNESFLDCLKRELQEELGAKVKAVAGEVGPVVKETHGSVYETKVYRLYLERNKFVLDKKEISEIVWVDPEEITAYVVSKSVPEYYSLLEKDPQDKENTFGC